MEPYRVLSARGYMLGEFWRSKDAAFALENWHQATMIVVGSVIVARKVVSP